MKCDQRAFRAIRFEFDQSKMRLPTRKDDVQTSSRILLHPPLSNFVFSTTHSFSLSHRTTDHKTHTMASLTMDASGNDMMMDDVHDESNERTEMNLSNAATTIDPSVGSSRISQSASLQKQGQMEISEEQPHFPELSAVQASGNKIEYRRVRCPPHRYTPLRDSWEQILTPLVEYLKLQVCTARRHCWTDFLT
jgi:hypothetical protein